MSVVRDLILQADDDLRYPTSGELRTMVEYLDQGAMRVSVVKVLTDNEKKIIDEAAKQLFSRKPEYVAPVATPMDSGNAPSASGIQLVPAADHLRRSGRQYRDDPGDRSRWCP